MQEVATIQTLNNIYPVAELRDLATAFVSCNFYGFKRPEEALVLMLKARADGVDPMTAADQYSIIQGRPALKSEAILIRFQSAGGKIRWKNRTDESCTLWLSHPAGGELEVTWDKERAIKARLWNKDNFQKHPAQMLAARCISEGVRALYPACLSGCYTPEEAQFFNDKDEAPAPAPEQVAEPAKSAEKPRKAKKAEKAVEAEVVAEPVQEEPAMVSALKEAGAEEVQAEPAKEIDEATQNFINYMGTLRNSNKLAFDQAWGAYTNEYGCDFAKVPHALQRTVYVNMKQAIANIVAANINEHLEG